MSTPSVHLPHFTANLKKRNARRKFKGGVDAVIAELRLLQAAGGAGVGHVLLHFVLVLLRKPLLVSYMPLANSL